MAYEVVMSYHLHMPSYFLGTFTEYPYRIFVECYLPPQVRAVNHGRYGSFTCKMLYLTAVRL